jgi:serine/threonine-protein kinase
MSVRLDEGTTLDGRFRLDELIGAGGMGAVYAGFDLQQGHRVAVKVLEARLAEDATFRERFLTESRMASRLTHPNILPVHAHGEDSRRHYMVMPLVETDLGALVGRDGALDVTRALNIADQVAWALDVAHAQGLIHRDVKPENVLLAPRPAPDEPDHAYLGDFGIAKLDDSPGLTRTGAFLGTASYTSPEQSRAEPLDGRSDQYSLACVLFESLTGHPPFPGAGVAEVLAAHRQTPRPRASDLRPELGDDLDAILAQGLAVDSQARFATCRELVAHARAAAPATSPAPASAPPPAAVAGAVVPPSAGAPIASPMPTPAAPTITTAATPGPSRRLWAAMAAVIALVTIAALLATVLTSDRGPDDPQQPPSASESSAPDPAPGPAIEPPAPEPPDAPDPAPPANPAQGTNLPQATLEVAEDGCGVIRSDFPSGEPGGLQWSITDEDGFAVLERNAAGEDRYRYFQPGRYEVVLEAFGEDGYEEISNGVSIEC